MPAFGIRCTGDDGKEWIMRRGHQVGPFATMAEAEKSAKKKNKIAATKGVAIVFAAVPIGVDAWGMPCPLPTEVA